MPRVFLADDHQPVRSALRLLLEHEPDLSIVGESGDAERVVDAAGAACPDLVLLNCELFERARGLVAALRAACRAVRVLALSSRPEDRALAADAGADAFLCMGEPPERLLATVRALLGG